MISRLINDEFKSELAYKKQKHAHNFLINRPVIVQMFYPGKKKSNI